MLKVGISPSSFGDSDDRALHLLRTRNVEVVMNPHKRRLSREEASEFVRDLDGLIAGLEPLDRDVLRGASRLRAIARVGIGMDNVDSEAAKEFGISLSNTPEPPTQAVAELTMTAMLALIRDFVPSTRSTASRRWDKAIQGSLSGAVVHILGLGRIGRAVASLAHAFGARVVATDPFVTEKLQHIELVELKDGLQMADVVSVHSSGSEAIIGQAEFAAIRRGAILLNSARGSLVDETALVDALRSGQLRCAWFDAFWVEPYNGALLDLPNFYATPHVGTYTAQCRSSMELEAAENLLRDISTLSSQR